LIDAVLKMLKDRVVPIAAGRVVRSSMAGVGAEQPFLTAAHRQIIGQSGQRRGALRTSAIS